MITSGICPYCNYTPCICKKQNSSNNVNYDKIRKIVREELERVLRSKKEIAENDTGKLGQT